MALAFLFTASANASQLIDRNASRVTIAVNSDGVALLTYSAKGVVHHVLARGAVDALAPSPTAKQVKFQLDYSGGWGFFKNANYWKKFVNVCGLYTGPKLPWPIKPTATTVTACTMPDGSNWAVQSWQRALKDYGMVGTTAQNVWELRLSHWSTDLAVLSINTDWSYHGKYDHLWGKLTYLGNPVFGYKHTTAGTPLDDWGRNIYVDTFHSAYGAGWKRENSFLTHVTSGAFCYGFYPHTSGVVRRPMGNGTKYRATVIGPGVTPDVTWQGPEPGPYNATADAAANAQQAIDLAGDTACVIN